MNEWQTVTEVDGLLFQAKFPQTFSSKGTLSSARTLHEATDLRVLGSVPPNSPEGTARPVIAYANSQQVNDENEWNQVYHQLDNTKNTIERILSQLDYLFGCADYD